MCEILRKECPSCNSTKICINKNFSCLWETLGEEIYLTVCRNCGLGFFDKILTEEQIILLYDDNYFKSEWCWYARPYQEVWEERKNDFEKLQLKWIKKLKSFGKVLDIGCAGGAIVKAFQEAGYEAIGVELNEHLAEFGREKLRVNIESMDVTRSDFANKYREGFDIIYMADILEHLNEPRMFLMSIMPVLKNDGVIVIEVPMFELNRFSSKVKMIYSSIKNTKIRISEKPYHVIFFNPNSLIKLCENSGYEVIYAKTWKENVLNAQDYRKMSKRVYFFNKLDNILPRIFSKVFDDRLFIAIKKEILN